MFGLNCCCKVTLILNMRDKIILLFTIFYAQTIAHDNDIKIKRGGQATNIQNIIYNFVRNYEGLCMPVRLMT